MLVPCTYGVCKRAPHLECKLDKGLQSDLVAACNASSVAMWSCCTMWQASGAVYVGHEDGLHRKSLCQYQRQ